MTKASEYRRNAQECRRLIATVSDSHQKAMLQNMADTWESLAADRERRLSQKQRIASLEESSRPDVPVVASDTQKPPQ